MMKLSNPPIITRIARTVYSPDEKGVWHLLKYDRLALCNRYFSHGNIEESTLEKCGDGEMCEICWNYGYEIEED